MYDDTLICKPHLLAACAYTYTAGYQVANDQVILNWVFLDSAMNRKINKAVCYLGLAQPRIDKLILPSRYWRIITLLHIPDYRTLLSKPFHQTSKPINVHCSREAS